MKKRNIVILVIVIIIIVIGTTYAFYTANVTTENDSNTTIITKAYANATMTNGTNIDSNEALPGYKAVKDITITGSCQNNASECESIEVSIVVDAVIDEAFKSDVTWYLIKSDEVISCNDNEDTIEGEKLYSETECEGINEEVLSRSLISGNKTGKKKIDITVGKETNETYYLYVEYKNNGDQNDQQGKEFNRKTKF